MLVTTCFDAMRCDAIVTAELRGSQRCGEGDPNGIRQNNLDVLIYSRNIHGDGVADTILVASYCFALKREMRLS